MNANIEGLDVTETSTWTPYIPCLYGAYRWLNGTPLHYFNTNVSVRDLHSHVRLMSQIEGVEKWGFEALFQRSISWERVNEIVERYLRNPSRFKFFPPVTMALLPVSDGKMHTDYSSQNLESSDDEKYVYWKMPGLEIKFLKQGGGTPKDSGQVALLRWDSKILSAVAIDGQHRIAALKKYRDASHPDAPNADVPATFLVFDPHLPQDKHLLNLVREIFVDVNHNAKTVEESRIILLDDRDFIRRAARSCVFQSFNDKAEAQIPIWLSLEPELGTKYLPGIPQELIDLSLGKQGADVHKLRSWQYISVFNLYRILKFFIFENNWETFETTMETSSLEPGDGPVGAAVSTKRPDPGDEEPDVDENTFVFSPAIGEELLKNYFDPHVRPLLLGVLTGIKPYKALIERALTLFENSKGPELREFIIAESSVDRSSQSELALNWETHKPELLTAVKDMQKQLRRPDGWENDLIWYSVTQRAFFHEVSMIRRSLEYFCDENSPKTFFHFIERYVTAISALWEAGVFAKDYKPCGSMPLWFGSPLEWRNGEFVIRPSDAAAAKMGKLIRILVAASHAKSCGWDAADFFREALGGNSAGLKRAFTVLRQNYQKYLKNSDASRGKDLKDDQDYEASAERKLKNLVRAAIFKTAEEADEGENSDTDPETDEKI
jgi:DGQHR domain-containing protein